MKQKIFSLISALLLSAGMMQAAVVNGTCGSNLSWSLNTKDSTLTIEGTGDMTSYPWSTHKSYIRHISLPNGLTSICNRAFSECSSLEEITIPNSVTSIGERVFYECYSLTAITIPDNVTSIGEACFLSCTSLKSAVVGTGITTVAYGLFRYCSSLTYVTLPNTLTNISGFMFGNCSSLKSVEIPNSVTTIDEFAFRYGALTSIIIGSGVTQISDNAFEDCRINKVTIYATTPPLASANCGIYAATCKLYVPAESITTYQNTIWWEDFSSIRAIGSASIVNFVDWNGSLLKSEEVNIGDAAVAPVNPSREGFTFIGWDKDFSNVVEDMTITAQYKINRYKVDFVDWDGTILKTDSVEYGKWAHAPENPYRQGYTFRSWDKEYYNITSNLIVNAQYELGEERNFIINFSNEETTEEILSQIVKIRVPIAPEIEGFTFLGWRPVAVIIESNTIEIEAVYEAVEPSAVPGVVTNPANPAQKLIRDGNVYILRDNKLYTITGNVL